jgi:zinc protease
LGLGGGSFQTKKQYVNDLLRFVGQVYGSATFPSEELELVRKEFITMLEESAKDPDSLAQVALERHFSSYGPGDWRYVPTISEHVARIKAVTREQVLRYARLMRGLDNAEVAIVGDFDVAPAKAALDTAFATSKRLTPYARVNREHRPTDVKNERIATPDKENATYMTRISFPLMDSTSDYPALMLADFIVGGSAGSRLFQRVRETEGLSYDVFSNLNVPTFANNASWTFGFISNPPNAARAEAALKDELRKLLDGTLTEEEFAAQKQSLLDQRMVRRSQDATLAAQLVVLADADRTYATVEAWEAGIRALKKTDFDTVLKKYINLNQMSSVLAGDFSKVK